MPRVVPSQIVSVIDKLFPALAKQKNSPGQEITLDYTHSYSISAVIILVDQVPPELIIIPEDEYAIYMAGIAAAKNAVEIWKTRGNVTMGNLQSLPGLTHLNPITIIRNALEKCPDQIPKPSTAELLFISDVDLRESIRLDISVSNQSFVNGDWKSTTILSGSAIEAILLDQLQTRKSPHVIKAAVSKLKVLGELSNKLGNSIDSWNLDSMLKVAREVQLIRLSTFQQADLARDFRNLIHPGKSVRLGQACNRGTALTALAALEHGINDLI